MKLFVGALALVALAGCSTSPISVDEADPVPPSRLHAFTNKSDSKLIVTRDSGAFGSGVNYSIFIDGKLAAEFASSEVATFGIGSGKHILGIKPSTMFGGTVHEAEIDVKPGETIRRRISLDGGGFYLTPTAY
ncbi:hypothetical protein NYP20_16075 [Pseudomonas sp. N3-W]|jgi:hypothetical protein|uniref:hypothetical protein n=1 Tax=Pseudomonas sp. N3-W TaxID=2975049 RepID=UPI00217F194B|nr:hypothetical protein [Pseudomonas sp. N3-W]UWF46866.1 hypothetical protein NYP20_16075 [Pseudomonas sp. N3-W]